MDIQSYKEVYKLSGKEALYILTIISTLLLYTAYTLIDSDIESLVEALPYLFVSFFGTMYFFKKKADIITKKKRKLYLRRIERELNSEKYKNFMFYKNTNKDGEVLLSGGYEIIGDIIQQTQYMLEPRVEMIRNAIGRNADGIIMVKKTSEFGYTGMLIAKKKI